MVTTAPPMPRARTTLALALATAAASAPSVVGVVLTLSLAAIGNVGWSAAAGLVSGALLRRADRRLAFAAGTALWFWFVSIAAPLACGYRWSDFDAEWWRVFAAGTGAATFVAGCRPRRWVVALVLVALVGVMVLARPASPVYRAGDLRRCSHAALTGGAILAAWLGTRRRAGSAVIVISLAALQHLAVRHVVFGGWHYVDAVAAVALMPPTYLAGAVASELAGGAERDGGTRLVVVVQRRPWVTCVALASAVAGLAASWIWRSETSGDAFDWLTVAPIVPAGFAFIAHAGRGARSSADRLAPWLVANLAAFAIAPLFHARSKLDIESATAFGLAAAATLWPLACAGLIPGAPPGDATPLAATVLPALVVTFPPIVAAAFPDWSASWAFTATLCLLLVPLAFHAAVRSRMRSATVVCIAASCGIAWWCLASRHASAYRPPPSPFVAPAVWTLAGLLVIAARRARSMTAVPLDHPIVDDLAGA